MRPPHARRFQVQLISADKIVHYDFVIAFNSSPTFLASVGYHLQKTRKDIHLPAMRGHRGSHHKGEFHLVKRPLQLRSRKGANDSAAFVARDIRLLSTDDAV